MGQKGNKIRMDAGWVLKEFSLRQTKDGERIWSYVEIERLPEIATYSSRTYSQPGRCVDAARVWASMFNVKLADPDLDLSYVPEWVVDALLGEKPTKKFKT
jgi:hypothetical protein